MELISRKNKIIHISLISYILLYFILILNVLPQFSSIINCIFVVVLAISSFILYKFKRFEFNEINKKNTILVFISLIIYFSVIYLLGLFTGYGRDIYSNSFLTIIKNSILPLLTVVSLEFVRYNYISNNKESKKNVYFITFLIIILDIIINFYFFDMNLKNLFIFITVTILPIIFKNILLSYLTYKIGYYPCLVYVVPLCLFTYVALYKPILGNYLSCVVNIAFPALVYIYSSRLISENMETKKNKNVKRIIKIIFLDVPLLLIFTIFIGLISGYFKYHLIGVENSKIKNINKGDAIFINRSYSYDDYEKGDIIAYKNGKKIIIDKITRISFDKYGNQILYITKEINKGKKDTYKKISEKNMLGKYINIKISKIAKPTIWFKKVIGDLNGK